MGYAAMRCAVLTAGARAPGFASSPLGVTAVTKRSGAGTRRGSTRTVGKGNECAVSPEWGEQLRYGGGGRGCGSEGASCLCTCYAMSGTGLAYAAMTTGLSYDAMQYPVLAYRMQICDVRC
eukprot:1646286-Rhodomonas_salina.2